MTCRKYLSLIQVSGYFPNLTQRYSSGLIDPRNVAWLHLTSSEELHISDSAIRMVHILEHDQITLKYAIIAVI